MVVEGVHHPAQGRDSERRLVDYDSYVVVIVKGTVIRILIKSWSGRLLPPKYYCSETVCEVSGDCDMTKRGPSYILSSQTRVKNLCTMPILVCEEQQLLHLQVLRVALLVPPQLNGISGTSCRHSLLFLLLTA